MGTQQHWGDAEHIFDMVVSSFLWSCRKSSTQNHRPQTLVKTTHHLILHILCCVLTKLPLLSVVGNNTGTALRSYQHQIANRFSQPRDSMIKTTHDIIPERYTFSGGPSSVGTISNAANIPAIFAHMLLRAKTRPGHSRAPNPNAWIGYVGTVGENQRSGLNRSGSVNMLGSCSIPLRNISCSDTTSQTMRMEGMGSYQTFGIIIEPAGM